MDKVLQVATKLFARQGYAGTSIVEIARDARVSGRTIYQHFGDKAALFESVVCGWKHSASASRLCASLDEPLFDVLVRAAEQTLNEVLSDVAVTLMRMIVAEHARFPELAQRTAEREFTRIQKDAEHLFAALHRQGTIPPGDHSQTADLFLDLILGQAPPRHYAGLRSGAPSRRDIETKIDLFILGRFGPTLGRGRSSPNTAIFADTGRNQ